MLFDVLSRQRRFVYLLIGILSVAGVWSALRLPSAIYPELRFSRITVVAQGPTLGARQNVFKGTRPPEKAVRIVPRVTPARPPTDCRAPAAVPPVSGGTRMG